MIEVDAQTTALKAWTQPNDTDDWSVLVLTTSFCQPCKQMKPSLELLHNSDHKFNFHYAVVDSDPEVGVLSTEYGVTAVPTLILFDSDGVEVKRTTGGMSMPELAEWLDIQIELDFPTL